MIRAPLRDRACSRRRSWRFLPAQVEPEEAAPRQGEEIRKLADTREACTAEHLLRLVALETRQVELDRLGRASDVVNAEHDVFLVTAQHREDARVRRPQDLVLAAAEHRMLFAERDEAMQPTHQ